MNQTIDSKLRHKTISYIIIGILIVIALAIYIYMTISTKEAQNQSAANSSAQSITVMTPDQAAARVAAIDQITSQHSVSLTPEQVTSKEASLSALEAGSK